MKLGSIQNVYYRMDLKKINSAAACENKPSIKLNELTEGAPNLIYSIKIVNGTFGRVPLVELEKNVVFLPKRTTETLEENINNFSSEKYALVYTGDKELYKGKSVSLFEIHEL